jgi:2-polyprenyl-3-methyl-5-hydroxy-6-metoxy-1,4-benzoquinol methylase
MNRVCSGLPPDYHDMVRGDVIPHVPKSGGTLLDVGGGSGATAARVKVLGNADRVGVVDVVDCPAEGVDTDFCYTGDVEDEEFMAGVIANEGPFSTILCLDILEHLVDPWRLVAQLHNGLAPQGVLVGSIPNVRNYLAVLPLFFRNRWQLRDAGILDRTHLRFFVRSTAIELMTSSGLELVSVHPSPLDGRKVRLFRKVTLGLLNSFTDRQYIVCVRRTC